MPIQREVVLVFPQVGGFCDEPPRHSPLEERAAELREQGFVVHEYEYGNGDGANIFIIEWDVDDALYFPYCAHCYICGVLAALGEQAAKIAFPLTISDLWRIRDNRGFTR